MAFKKKIVEIVEPVETVQEIMDTVKITEPTEPAEPKVSNSKFYVYDSRFNIHSFVTSIEEAISESEKIGGKYKEIK